MFDVYFTDAYVLLGVHLIAWFDSFVSQKVRRVDLGCECVGKVSKWVGVIVGDVAQVPSKRLTNTMFYGQAILSQSIIS